MKNRTLPPCMALIAALSAPTVCQAQAQRSREFKDKYKLQEAVVLSRHNIRAPLSDSKSALGRMTLHAPRGPGNHDGTVFP